MSQAAKIEAESEKGLPKVVIAAIIAVVVIVVVVVVMSRKQAYEPMVAGADIMDFELPDLSGKAHKLSEYKGKVVFLNFWATWCKPCEEEIPSMQQLYDNLKGLQFEIVAVSVDKDGPEQVSQFLKQRGVTFPVLQDRKGSIKDAYKTTGVPETFIIDQNGVVAEKVWGPRDWNNPEATKVVMDLLKNGPKKKEEYRLASKKH